MPPSFYQPYFSPLQPRTYHVFISHSWDYGDDRENLGSLIANGLSPDRVIDYSAPKEDPIHAATGERLVQALYQRIDRASVLIFPAGVYASYSTWIPIEVAIANQLQKPIIAVEKWGAERSSTIAQQASELVGWNSRSVATAIKTWHG